MPVRRMVAASWGRYNFVLPYGRVIKRYDVAAHRRAGRAARGGAGRGGRIARDRARADVGDLPGWRRGVGVAYPRQRHHLEHLQHLVTVDRWRHGPFA